MKKLVTKSKAIQKKKQNNSLENKKLLKYAKSRLKRRREGQAKLMNHENAWG